VSLHNRLKHEHIVGFWLALDDAQYRHIIMEHCEGGDLRAVLGVLSERQLRDTVVRPLLGALTCLQEQVRSLLCHCTTQQCRQPHTSVHWHSLIMWPRTVVAARDGSMVTTAP
jgi:hypothetical protein